MPSNRVDHKGDEVLDLAAVQSESTFSVRKLGPCIYRLRRSSKSEDPMNEDYIIAIFIRIIESYMDFRCRFGAFAV